MANANDRIGFMQGRFSPVMKGKIQAFPWDHWRTEFETASQNGFRIMEWTLDQDRLNENPLMKAGGRKEIIDLMKKHGIAIPSLTGDCFMQAPFYKTSGQKREQLIVDLANIIKSSADIGINIILIPLVDDGRIENQDQENNLLQGLTSIIPSLKKSNIIISFESDFPPGRLLKFIDNLDPSYFGITYDIGNSAALGYDYEEEIKTYGHRIVNVHVKDRVLNGTTVPLGEGNANIFGVLQALRKINYSGNYILQAARAADEKHAELLRKYREILQNWLNKKAA